MTIQGDQLRTTRKDPCRLATTADHGLTGLSAIDGVTPVAGNRILVKSQTSGEENGIYVAASGAWARSNDMNDVGDDNITAGLEVYIQEGSVATKKSYILTTTGTIVLDTTVLVFEEGPTAGAAAAGDVNGPGSSIDNSIPRFDSTTGKILQGGVASNNILIDDTGNIVPEVSDGGSLGTASLQFSDLFLASGSVINLANGDVTLTHATDTLTFAGAATGYLFGGGPVRPTTNDGAALGTTAFQWSDLFLATGAVVNFNNGDVTITHSADALAFAGATAGYSMDNPLFLAERATGLGDTAGLGQIWVRSDTPNVLVFTDDTGTDWDLNTAGGSIGGSTGATDNAILRADGSGGTTLQNSGVTISDAALIAGASGVLMTEQASSPSVSAGQGAFWVDDTVPSTPQFTNDLGGEIALVQSHTVLRDVPTAGGDTIEVGNLAINGFGRSKALNFELVVTAGFGTTNQDSASVYLVAAQSNQTAGTWQKLQPLVSSMSDGSYRVTVEVMCDFTAFYLRLRPTGAFATIPVHVRIVQLGSETNDFTSTSAVATTTAATTIYAGSGITCFGGTNPGKVQVWNTLMISERAAAITDEASFGQLWVKDDSPNTLWFTADNGTEYQLGIPSSSAPTQLQAVFVSKGGNNGNSGLTKDAPKLTIASAITAASALTPTTNKRIAIYIQDAAHYSEAFTLPDYVSLVGPNASVSGSTNVTMGVESLVSLNRITGTATGVVCAQAGRCWIHVNEITGQDGIRTTNASAEVFIRVGTISSAFHGIYCANGTAGTFSGSVEEILITATGNAIRIYDTGRVDLRVGRIRQSGTAWAVRVEESGGIANLVVADINVTNTIFVATGATLNLVVGSMTGAAGTVTGTVNIRSAAGPMYMEEQAAAGASTAKRGQLWVRNDTPNVLVFTNDVGTDRVIGTVGGSATVLNGNTSIVVSVGTALNGKRAVVSFAAAPTAATIIWAGVVAAGNLTINIDVDNTADLDVHYLIDAG